MNLFKFHIDPNSLYNHDEAQEQIPDLFWNKYMHNGKELDKRRKYIALDPYYAYAYADKMKEPFPEAEDVIMNSPWKDFYLETLEEIEEEKGNEY